MLDQQHSCLEERLTNLELRSMSLNKSIALVLLLNSSFTIILTLYGTLLHSAVAIVEPQPHGPMRLVSRENKAPH